ncbi:MAG: hypothetical protein AABX71_00910 [Nanoarchaeota archaeon]
MAKEVASYRHDLGNGLYLDAFAVDPNLTEGDLREFVVSRETGGVDLEEVGKNIRMIEPPEGNRLWTLGELNFGAEDRRYQIPEQLRAYREALAIRQDINGNFNGPISVIEGRPGRDIRFIEGGFYDWKGTQVADSPTDLLENLLGTPVESLVGEARFRHARGQEDRFGPRYDTSVIDRFRARTLAEFLKSKGCSEETIERFSGKTIGDLLDDEEFARAFDIEAGQVRALKEKYPAGKTLGNIMAEYGLKDEERARYFGFAHFIFPENGEKLQLVHRAKKMIVAPDCISSAGSTPRFSKDFFKPGFNFQQYYEEHIAQEMNEEFKLEKGEFGIKGFYFSHLINTGILNPAFEITSPLTTKEMVDRIHGDEEAVSEHPVVYGMPVEAVPVLLKRFDVLPDIAFILNRLYKDTKAA